MKNCGRALEIGANVGTAFASRNPKAASTSPPEVINFYHTEKVLYLRKLKKIYAIYLDQKTPRLYPSAPVEKIILQQRLEKKPNDVNSFNISNNIIKELFTFFKDKHHKSKKEYRMLTIKLKSSDTFVIIAATSSSITLSLTRIILLVIPLSTGILPGITIGNKVIFQILIRKYIRYRNKIEKSQQTIKSFAKLYRRGSRCNSIDKSKYESSCNIFSKYLDETEKECYS